MILRLVIRFISGLASVSIELCSTLALEFRKPVFNSLPVYFNLPKRNVAALKAETFPTPSLSPADRALHRLRDAAIKTDHDLFASCIGMRVGRYEVVGSGGDVWTKTRERLHKRLQAAAA